MEDLGVEVGQVAHDEDEDGLDDAHVVGEARDESGEEAPDDADRRAAQRHHQKVGQPRQHVRGADVLLAHADVRVEHVVQHLHVPDTTSAEFYRVLPSFTEFYRALPSFTN